MFFPVRLLTWNINSIRLRFDVLRQVVETLRPDIVCLQETKVVNDLFPADSCRDLGYPHLCYQGMKGYNGVAILSRLPIEHSETLRWCGRDDCRHIAATIAGVDVHCLYIPAGGDIPDPEQNPKFAHKLDFLRELTAWSERSFAGTGRKAVLTGDFNIAPLESDVWSHKQLLSVVSHTPVEVEMLETFRKSADWVDAMRAHIPPDQKLFTWWSYRSPDWKRNDRGRRLDHVWVSPMLAQTVRSVLVARECRDWAPPSDHVPVLADLDTGL